MRLCVADVAIWACLILCVTSMFGSPKNIFPHSLLWWKSLNLAGFDPETAVWVCAWVVGIPGGIFCSRCVTLLDVTCWWRWVYWHIKWFCVDTLFVARVFWFWSFPYIFAWAWAVAWLTIFSLSSVIFMELISQSARVLARIFVTEGFFLEICLRGSCRLSGELVFSGFDAYMFVPDQL